MRTSVLLAVALGALAPAGCDPPGERGRAGSCATGPWADHCPEARWAREVAAAAGFDVTGDTGSAVNIERGRTRLHLWAFTPEQPELRDEQLDEEAYDQRTTVGGVAVFGDGIRVTWETYGLHVWLASERARGLDVSAPAVADVVRASAAVPWP